MTRARKFTIVVIGFVVSAAVVTCMATVANPGWRLARAYPGSSISVYHSYSPDPSPYDLVRFLSPVPYIGPGEYVSIGLKNLPYPLRFDPTRGERIGYIYVANCTVEDISTLLPHRDTRYVLFRSCDFSRLPKEQRDQLSPTWDTVANQYVYSIGSP
jgi:hypothetical protein